MLTYRSKEQEESVTDKSLAETIDLIFGVMDLIARRRK